MENGEFIMENGRVRDRAIAAKAFIHYPFSIFHS
jgi:hypothetical protein